MITQSVASATAQVGETYKRTKYEVHSLSPSGWRGGSRFDTLEEARQSLERDKESDKALRGFIDLGKPAKTRIVKAVSECTVIE